MKGICIFGASSQKAPDIYKEAAKDTGIQIVKSGFSLVFGAGGHGLMGAAAQGAAQEGGKIIGVIPEKLNLPGIASSLCTEVIVTPTMHVRKQTMENLSCGFIALAGGFGTLEELLEVITLKQLGYIDLPIVVLNTNHYYDNLIEMFNRCVKDNFTNEKYLGLIYVAETPEQAVDYIKNYSHSEMPNKMLEVLKSMKSNTESI